MGKSTPFLSDYMPDEPDDKRKMDLKYGGSVATSGPYTDSLSLTAGGDDGGPSEEAAVSVSNDRNDATVLLWG